MLRPAKAVREQVGVPLVASPMHVSAETPRLDHLHSAFSAPREPSQRAEDLGCN